VPHGRVCILVATIGRTQNVFNDKVFGMLVAMSLITGLVVKSPLATE
jgi:hypothetical protein